MQQAPFATPFAHSVYASKYAHTGEDWYGTSNRVASNVMAALYSTDGARMGRVGVTEIENATDVLYGRIAEREFIPGGRYLYATGNDLHQVQNCLLLRAEDTREGWADLAWKSGMALMTGAGIGVYYGDVREKDALIKRTGGKASGPTVLAVSINEQGRAYVQGGDRRAAIWGGLLWSHPDCEKYWITAKDWPQYLRDQKAIDPATPAPLDMTNISVCLDDEFFEAYADQNHPMHERAGRVYWKTIEHMVTRGEPGFSVDLGERSNEKLRNACTEICSEDDSDICNLGGMVLPRFDDPKAFGEAVRDAVLFLTAGTLYSDVPYDRVDEIRTKNRRLGLDILGVHEFLLARGLRYGTDDAFEALEPYMDEYRRALEYANDWQERLGVTPSIAATSGAPTGTRAIIAETTTGWEPVSSAAYKRIVRQSHGAGEIRHMQYVVDPTVRRLAEQGKLDIDNVEDAHSLSKDVERRLRMQQFAQSYTDQAISMTINLPHQMFETNEQRSFGEMLLKYLPSFRGITCYPDGAIPGQPIQPVPVSEALGQEGVIFEESEEKCASGVCGI